MGHAMAADLTLSRVGERGAFRQHKIRDHMAVGDWIKECGAVQCFVGSDSSKCHRTSLSHYRQELNYHYIVSITAQLNVLSVQGPEGLDSREKAKEAFFDSIESRIK